MRLAILTSHPIQYYAPWFRHLAGLFELEVLYCHRQDASGQGAAGFGVNFDWDVPLLDGYKYRWLKNISRRPGLSRYDGCDTPELADLIHPGKYDALLVIGWNRKSALQGIRAAWRNKLPTLSRGDSQLRTQRSLLKRALKYIPYRWALPRISAHLYVGARNRQYLEHYGVRSNQMFLCPHFVDNSYFAMQSNQAKRSGAARRIREDFGIPHSAFVALFVGKFISKKRPSDFCDAITIAARAQNSIHGLLVGDGPERQTLQAAHKSMSTRIHFAGFRNQSELPSYYAAADLLVLPSNAEETWGLVVNEAMACGLPAIVSDAAGCAPDMIDPGMTGWTYPMGDIQRLASILMSAHALPVNELAIRDKVNAHSMKAATNGLIRALDALVGAKASRSMSRVALA